MCHYWDPTNNCRLWNILTMIVTKHFVYIHTSRTAGTFLNKLIMGVVLAATAGWRREMWQRVCRTWISNINQKSVGAPPSSLRRSTNASSSSRMASSIGGASNSFRICFHILLARSGVLIAPRSSHVSKLFQSLKNGA